MCIDYDGKWRSTFYKYTATIGRIDWSQIQLSQSETDSCKVKENERFQLQTRIYFCRENSFHFIHLKHLPSELAFNSMAFFPIDSSRCFGCRRKRQKHVFDVFLASFWLIFRFLVKTVNVTNDALMRCVLRKRHLINEKAVLIMKIRSHSYFSSANFFWRRRWLLPNNRMPNFALIFLHLIGWKMIKIELSMDLHRKKRKHTRFFDLWLRQKHRHRSKLVQNPRKQIKLFNWELFPV